ncbi:1-phosphatidylinositol 4,5-bisphosphate phosphodiesterase eta-1 isoform X3 [Dendrobates tinctorius]|uniref:1-phosphatidylinositol 4,5-bisphosphate phosphodiesterase eta-1 isoform X3 n=1 Tax=Dendrobates tinctorius TaxID=92724 RepID=UPI003CC9FADD
MHKLNVNLPRRKVRQMFQEADTDENQGMLTFEEFSVFYKMMSLRRDLYLLLLSYSDKKDHLTVDELAQFLKMEQKMNNVTTEYCLDVIQKFEVSEENKEQKVLGIEGFTSFMRGPAGDIFNPLHCEIYQDMEQPLCNYYIASSHNTYLTGDQLLSQSKVDMYAWVLQDGCRCIEVDCWDGPDGEPVVHHGYTLTSKIPFKDVVETINKHAFVKNDYPVVLSIENHCNIQQQRKIAQYLKEIFGDKLDLSSVPLGENKQLPSPQHLKGKILVKGKKLPYDLAEDAEEGEVSDEDSADEIEEECKLSHCFSNGTTEHQVESFIRKKLESLLKESQIRDKEDPDSFTVRALLKATHEGLNVNLKQNSEPKDRGKSKRSSMGNIGKHKRTAKSRSKSCSTDEDEDSSPRETGQMNRLGRRRKTMKLCRALSDLVVYTNSVSAQDIMDDGSTGNVLSFSETRAHQVVQQKSEQFMMYNQKQLTRIYPSAYRIDSSNFNPVPYWNSGIQLVALNYQTEGRMMELNRAKFKVNGNCGYVLKPQQMCKGVFNPFSGDPLPASPKKQLILKVISGQQLPKPPDSMLGDRGEIIDPFVEVEIIGLSVDCCKEQTRVVDDNGFNPVWEETLTFTVHMPEIALVRFLVWDHDPIGRDFVGQRTVAFSSLMPGYRHVYLEGLTEASIFVHVTINEIYGKNKQFIGLKGFFNRSTKRGSVESNGHIRKRSIGERILRRTASAPAKGRKKTKMVFQESTDSKDFPCEVSATKEKDVVMRRTSRSLQARPVSMPVDKFLLGAFEPSTSESSKDTRLNDIGNERSKKNRPVTKEPMLEYTQNPACLPIHPCPAAATANGHVVHRKWRSLHLDYGKRCDDDIKEFNDTFTSESGDENEEIQLKSLNIEGYKQETSLNSFCQPISAASQDRFIVNDLMSITDFSTTVCTDANNLQSTAVILENDISEMIKEVPSLNDSDLGSSISALIRRFESTDEQTSLTCVSSLNGLNSHTKISGYSEIFTPAISTPRKQSSVPKHVDQRTHSANNTTIFSSPGTTEYSMYTIIHEENLSGSTLMGANDRLVDESRVSPCKPAHPETKPKSAKLVYPEIKPKPTNIRPASMENLLSSSSTNHINCLTNRLPSGPSNKFSTGGPFEFQKASQGLQDVSQPFHAKNIGHSLSHLPYQKNFNNFVSSDKLCQNTMLHTNVEGGEVSNSFGIPHIYQRRDQKNSNALKDTKYIAHGGNLHTPYIPKQAGSNKCPTQGTNQPSPCKSKSLGDLTSEDISCNFDSKYKRINRGFLLSSNLEDSPSFVKSNHHSTDALTEQLRKLVSYDQEDCSKPSLYEEDELDKPRPLTRKLSSRSQSRVRNIANRAKEKQEAIKLKQSSPFASGVVLRNKPPTACPPVNRHSTGSYIAGYSSNFIREGLEGRGIPEGACSSQTYRHNDQFCIDRFTYQTESCSTEEPEVYFLLRL